MAVSAFKLGLQHGTKVKEDLTIKSSKNLKKILSQARGFMKLEEENSHYWGNVTRRRYLCKESIRRVERNRSIV